MSTGMTGMSRSRHTAKGDICRAVDNKQPKATFLPHEVPSRPWSRWEQICFHQTTEMILLLETITQTFGALPIVCQSLINNSPV